MSCFLFLGPKRCRNFDDDCKIIARNQDRCLTSAHLKRTLPNGETVFRNWVIYSPSRNAIFCFTCRLFGSSSSSSNTFLVGFTDFHNAHRSFQQHEKSQPHILSELAYRIRAKELKCITVDASFVNQTEDEMKYWRDILKRIVAVIKFLGSRGLAFRGANQVCGSIHNGNFLGILDLLSEFDPLISSHIARHGNKGRGNNSLIISYVSHSSLLEFLGRASYLSDTICDEFISLIGEKVLNIILAEIRDAKYFSISVDSTPDVSHCDQFSFLCEICEER